MTKKTKNTKRTILAISLVTATLSIASIINFYVNEQISIIEHQKLNNLYSESSISQPVSPISSEVVSTLPDFSEFISINEDFEGWLEVGDFTAPIVQGKDNIKYLTTDFYGKKNPHGTVFADFRNDLEVLGDNTILYGHNYDRSERIFYEVEKFKNIDYANANPIVTFTTKEKEHQFVVFGMFVTNTIESQGEVFDYHNQLKFDTPEASKVFLDGVAKRSLISTEIPVDYHDRLLTLSTCGYEFEGQRYVLIARELRPNETVADFGNNIYTSTVNPLMPEIWTNLYT